ncbi:MAG TPA: hypothetical protein VJ485_01540 [archaeon]|nr:hypothetical protein [archaeon]
MPETAPARVARVRLKEDFDPSTLDCIYSLKGVNYGGWREDEKGKYLRLIILGEEINTETFKKYHDVKDIFFEAPWA